MKFECYFNTDATNLYLGNFAFNPLKRREYKSSAIWNLVQVL